MIYSPTIISIIEVLLVSIPVLLTVAFVTVAAWLINCKLVLNSIILLIISSTGSLNEYTPYVNVYYK